MSCACHLAGGRVSSRSHDRELLLATDATEQMARSTERTLSELH